MGILMSSSIKKIATIFVSITNDLPCCVVRGKGWHCKLQHLLHLRYLCSPDGHNVYTRCLPSRHTCHDNSKRELHFLVEALDYFENLPDDDELITCPRYADDTISPPPPPADNVASDDDSGDESCNNPDVLPPKQLSTMAEIHTADDNETEDSCMQSDADEPDDKSDEELPARRSRAWVKAQCSGYCLAVDLYQGKTPNGTRPGDKGLGELVVLTFCDSLMTLFPGIQFSFYFDNFFFTNTKFICSLSEKGMKGTGTARINRMRKSPIADKKVMQKREMRSYEVYTEENKGISAVAWRDNNVVKTLSNEHGVQPVQYANQYSSKEKKSFEALRLQRCWNVFVSHLGAGGEQELVICPASHSV
ncbi:hypothetical protein PR048_014224 [Dryococelus australis]|uniref:PiggyBac transposable element-derived protein domain-containing protein n=1 Tax=Dryococelus australis TaxID=614101 RepID=A0ABQ9HDP5_9NEOP|nr:hypothetical protein PR048_014224 [Dryococelus australis]